jgi:aspartate aminotransferase-like enzyme
MQKIFLLTPGPTSVPPEVLSAQARPVIHHRTVEYGEIFMRVCEDLKYVFRTKNTVLVFTASGTGAMESSIVNLLSAGDKALVVKGGKFGERWAEICEAYGVKVVSVDLEWGDSVDPGVIKSHLEKDKEIKAVCTTLCETSTGVLTDIRAIGEIVKDTPAVLLVDAISGLGACEMRTDDWHVDVCVSGSQKGLMIPPGLAFASVSEKALKMSESSKLPKYYYRWKDYFKSLSKEQTPWTPAVSLVIGLGEALKLMKKEGIDNVIARHAKLAKATRAAVKALGLELFAKKPADAVTAIKVPEGVDGGKLKNALDHTYDIKVAGGQAHLKGKIIRIAHLGYANYTDILVGVSALEMSLADMGYKVELGKGVKAALEVLHAS